MNIISMQTVTANFAESHEPKRVPSMAGPWQFDRVIFNVQLISFCMYVNLFVSLMLLLSFCRVSLHHNFSFIVHYRVSLSNSVKCKMSTANIIFHMVVSILSLAPTRPTKGGAPVVNPIWKHKSITINQNL